MWFNTIVIQQPPPFNPSQPLFSFHNDLSFPLTYFVITPHPPKRAMHVWNDWIGRYLIVFQPT